MEDNKYKSNWVLVYTYNDFFCGIFAEECRAIQC